MKTIVKRIVAWLLFCLLVFALIAKTNDVLVYKKYNRYYVMDEAIAELDEPVEVQIFGACHSYTSFHTPYFEEKYGYSSYDFGNPGEIVPVTYLRMRERFKKDVPKVALVEIWGLNAHETYSAPSDIFGYFLPPNIERLPFSLEKLEVIRDYDSLDEIYENFAISKYKDRVVTMELEKVDFNYSLETYMEQTSAYSKNEMIQRTSNRGFCEMPMHLDTSWIAKEYTPYMNVSDYKEKQSFVEDDEKLAYEEDIQKYINKIIDLCEKKGVELIFYRAPYVSTENELKKSNWFEEFCAERGIAYIDLEKEISFDVEKDFLDYHHLNKYGAEKATDFLAKEILSVIQ